MPRKLTMPNTGAGGYYPQGNQPTLLPNNPLAPQNYNPSVVPSNSGTNTGGGILPPSFYEPKPAAQPTQPQVPSATSAPSAPGFTPSYINNNFNWATPETANHVASLLGGKVIGERRVGDPFGQLSVTSTDPQLELDFGNGRTMNAGLLAHRLYGDNTVPFERRLAEVMEEVKGMQSLASGTGPGAPKGPRMLTLPNAPIGTPGQVTPLPQQNNPSNSQSGSMNSDMLLTLLLLSMLGGGAAAYGQIPQLQYQQSTTPLGYTQWAPQWLP